MSASRWRAAWRRRRPCLCVQSGAPAAMVDFLNAAAGVLLTTTVGGLGRMGRAPTDPAGMMPPELAGSGGGGTLPLRGVAGEAPPVLDVALLLALLAAFASVAFVSGASTSTSPSDR